MQRPKEIIEFSDTSICIVWDDDHQSIYLNEELRQSCPCARCNDLKKPVKGKISFKHSIPIKVNHSDIKPRTIESIGHYAIRFKWSDGHETGIYTFEFLRQICTCEECSRK